jgi:hypothetical protein
MSNALQLQRYDGEGGIEILINPATGESFCSVRGYARMAGKNESTIRARVTGAGDGSGKMAEILTPGGLQGARLITEDQITAWLPKDNPAAATLLLKMGVRMALHKMAGYEIKSTAMPDNQPIVDPLDAQVQRAIALAGGGGAMALEAFKLIHGIHSPESSKSPATPSAKAKAAPKPPIVSKAEQDAEDIELIREFMADIQTLVDAGILGPWNVSTVTQKFKPYISIVLHKVIPILQEHFCRQIDRERLEAAIVRTGGSTGQTQRFSRQGASESDRKPTQSKCITIPAALVKT